MKKILLFIPTLKLGGAERQALNFALFLKSKGIEVAIAGIGKAYPDDVYVFKDMCAETGVPCFDVYDTDISRVKLLVCRIGIYIMTGIKHPPFLVRGMLGLMRILRRDKYETVVSYCAIPGTIAGMTKCVYRKMPKFIWYQRDAGIGNYLDEIQKRAITKADMLLANSVSGKTWLYEEYHIDALIIHNGVMKKRPEYSKEQWLEKLGVDSSYMIITMIANLTPEKDHMTLLKAWHNVIDRIENKKLLLVLAGRYDDEYDNLLKYVIQNHLSDMVKFTGPIKDVFGLYETSDLCAFSTLSEGNPNALIEAAMTGLAAVATDLPEIREVLSEENQEYLFRRGDVEDCSEKMIALLESESVRAMVGSKNQQKAYETFNMEERFGELLSYTMKEKDVIH